MARKLYPIGIQTFEEIRKLDNLYIDKTELYTLDIPNKEIRVGLFRALLPHYLTDKSAKANTTIAKMSVLVKKGDMDAAFCLLNDFLETVPYCDNTNYEGHWQQTRGGSRPDRGKTLCRRFQDERQEGGEDRLELLGEGQGELPGMENSILSEHPPFLLQNT